MPAAMQVWGCSSVILGDLAVWAGRGGCSAAPGGQRLAIRTCASGSLRRATSTTVRSELHRGAAGSRGSSSRRRCRRPWCDAAGRRRPQPPFAAHDVAVWAPVVTRSAASVRGAPRRRPRRARICRRVPAQAGVARARLVIALQRPPTSRRRAACRAADHVILGPETRAASGEASGVTHERRPDDVLVLLAGAAARAHRADHGVAVGDRQAADLGREAAVRGGADRGAERVQLPHLVALRGARRAVGGGRPGLPGATSGAIQGAPSIRCRATRWPPSSTTANASARSCRRASSSPAAISASALSSVIMPGPYPGPMR